MSFWKDSRNKITNSRMNQGFQAFAEGFREAAGTPEIKRQFKYGLALSGTKLGVTLGAAAFKQRDKDGSINWTGAGAIGLIGVGAHESYNTIAKPREHIEAFKPLVKSLGYDNYDKTRSFLKTSKFTNPVGMAIGYGAAAAGLGYFKGGLGFGSDDNFNKSAGLVTGGILGAAGAFGGLKVARALRGLR